MQIKSENDRGYVVISVSGRLDAVQSLDFEKYCVNLIELGNTKLILNFATLEYISSAGLRSILTIAKKLRACSGSLALSNLTGFVEEVISISGFDSFLAIYESVDKAIQGGS